MLLVTKLEKMAVKLGNSDDKVIQQPTQIFQAKFVLGYQVWLSQTALDIKLTIEEVDDCHRTHNDVDHGTYFLTK